MRTVLALLLLSFPAFAQEGLRDTDVFIDIPVLKQQLSGHVIEFYDGSKARFAADGTYGYTYTDDGPEWSGTYEIQGDSLVCVAFDNGSSRCDLYVSDGARMVLVTADGTRFPIRNMTVD